MLQTHTLFLRADGATDHVAQPRYVALVRGEQPAPEYGSQVVRVADFYVDPQPGGPAIRNETYTVLCFDEEGFVAAINEAAPPADAAAGAPPAYDAPTTGSTWIPTTQERDALVARLHEVCRTLA